MSREKAKSAKNAENGRKGGKAKKNFFSENSERLKNEANQAYNDNDNGNENDIDIYNGNGIGNGNGNENENDIAQANAPLTPAPTALRETPYHRKEKFVYSFNSEKESSIRGLYMPT